MSYVQGTKLILNNLNNNEPIEALLLLLTKAVTAPEMSVNFRAASSMAERLYAEREIVGSKPTMALHIFFFLIQPVPRIRTRFA